MSMTSPAMANEKVIKIRVVTNFGIIVCRETTVWGLIFTLNMIMKPEAIKITTIIK